ncbi:MAG: hypothetical protein IT210_24740 [Armatimonadetes bacterium]|nr:hypothetical protein [Armatimonadota bacterium]
MPADGAQIRIIAGETVQPRFGGVGFDACHHVFSASQEELDQVILKRWRELNPAFARMGHHRESEWSREQLDLSAFYLLQLKETGTEVFMVPWSPAICPTFEEKAAYARTVADRLEYLVRVKGGSNLRFYCLSNELSYREWADLTKDLPAFKDFHQALYDEFEARSLDIELLASDASPVNYWGTIEWAAQNMDEITGIYGGHHYFNDFSPEDPAFYPWFLSRLEWAAGIARSKGKEFILGEFGCKQDGRTIGGVLQDTCIHFDSLLEPLVAVQLAEAVIACLNAGVYAAGYWTFMDFPDESDPKRINKWGVFKNSGTDRSTRPHYYGYGLLTRYLRGPAAVCRVETGDPNLRAAALRRHGQETWSAAIVNRNPQPADIALKIEGEVVSAAFRKYVYDPQNILHHPFGDLPGPDCVCHMENGLLKDTVGPDTLTVYTTDYRDGIPAPVEGMQVEKTSGGPDVLTWQASQEPDHCYYRIYRKAASGKSEQIASTIAVRFTAEGAKPGERYQVVSVNRSGNAGLLSE